MSHLTATIEIDPLREVLSQPGKLEEFFAELKSERHPVLALPSLDQVLSTLALPNGREELTRVLAIRNAKVRAMEENPLQHGYRPPIWTRASALVKEKRQVLIMGGNRSAKTEFAAWTAMNDLIYKKNRIWAFLHSSAASSKAQQHPRLYKYFHPDWRNLGRVGKHVYVKYDDKNGFGDDGIFLLPNGSRGLFFNYMQEARVLEGYEFDGVWCDELVPQDFIDALEYRLVTRRGKLLITFTPTAGYTPTVGRFLAGAEVVETAPSPLLPDKVNVKGCPKGTMPLVMQCANSSAAVMFFFTQENPFNPYEEAVALLEGATDKKIKERAYGWPEKLIGSAFPKFGAVNILKMAGERPVLFPEGGLVPPHPWGTATATALYPGLPKKGANFVVCDPGFSKNWFVKWYRVGADMPFTFVYREWPDWATHGQWALPGDKADGMNGPGQRTDFGRGILDYKRMILEAEGWVWDEGMHTWDGTHAEPIVRRIMDCRGGGSEVPSVEEGTSLIQLMADEQTDKDGHVIGPRMWWEPSAGGKVFDGLQLLNNRFAYDTEQPVNVLNCPSWYVVEDCKQSIYAYREYTGIDGEKGALKDVVDPDRYFVKSNEGYIEPEMYGSQGGGAY